jgi:hypothetical protein
MNTTLPIPRHPLLRPFRPIHPNLPIHLFNEMIPKIECFVDTIGMMPPAIVHLNVIVRMEMGIVRMDTSVLIIRSAMLGG